MTTYLDLASIGPTPEHAKKRAELLHLSGKLVPEEWRFQVLIQVTGGDTIICGPLALNYWRALDEQVALVNVEEPTEQDPLTRRIKDWKVWYLVNRGIAQGKATQLIQNPPKTERHSHWSMYQDAVRGAPAFVLDGMEQLATFEEITAPNQPEQSDLPYRWRLIKTQQDIDDFTKLSLSFTEAVGVDVEVDVVGDDPNETQDKLVGVGVAVGDDCFYGLESNEPWMASLRTILHGKPFIAHNSKFDLAVSRRNGIVLGPPAGDGMLAAYLLGEPSAGLKGLVERHFGVRMITYANVVGTGKNRRKMSEVDPERQAEYCCSDAYWGVKIEEKLRSELIGTAKAQSLYHNVDLPLVPLLVDMELHGIRLNRDSTGAALDNIRPKLDQLHRVIDELVRGEGWYRPDKVTSCKGCHNGKNKKLTCEECHGQGTFSEPERIKLNGPDLGKFYYRHLGLPVTKVSRESGQPSTDRLALLRMKDKHVTIPLVLEWKRLQKYESFLVQWLEASKVDGRIHPITNNATVRSSRFSMQEPNAQQIAVPWREHFVADEGQVLIAADYGQVEVRIGAYVSHDPVMLEVVNSGVSIHERNVEMLFGAKPEVKHEQPMYYNQLKTRAKNYFFGAVYGSKGYEVHDVLEQQILDTPELADMQPPSVEEIMRGIRKVHNIYGRFFTEWWPYAIEMARQRGGWALTLFDRPRYLPNLFSKNTQEREAAERECISHIVQGTATGDIMRLALPRVVAIPNGRPLLVVHDEILSTVDRDKAKWYKGRMIEEMELGQPFEDIKLVVEAKIAEDWRATHG